MTVMWASEILRKLYQRYLAYAIEVRDNGNQMEDILIVK